MSLNQNVYKVFTLRSFPKIPQVQQSLTPQQIEEIQVVGNVLPFKVNNYVVDELIDWNNIPKDPIFQLTFPQKEMLTKADYDKMKAALDAGLSKNEITEVANEIRLGLNPHPAGQQNNVPVFDNQKLTGVQHKYRETLLFFPSNSQTCHAYCTFCFRWPQFVGIDELKFAIKETDLLVGYLKENPEVTDVLFTGGDPMVMKAEKFASYVEPLISGDISNLKTIRIGTKALGYWPYKFTTDKDADDMLRLFERVVESGHQLAFMAHFNHSRELETPTVQEAIRRIRNTGAQIRSQSPVMNHINNNADEWAKMWRTQANLGIIPYYMFVARDTGAQDYFAVSLENAWKIFRKAYQKVSGVARTVRGPSMSANSGKVQLLGISEVNGEKVMVLRFLQGRNPNWVGEPFFAKYNPKAMWLDDLKPYGGKKQFFFDEEMEEMKILSN